MKKFMLTLIAVCALTAPVVAATTISASDDGSDVLCVYYTGDDPCAVGVIVTNTSTDFAANPYVSASADSWFDVFMDYASGDPDNYVLGSGDPVASTSGAGVPTYPTGAISLCAGHLEGANGGTGVIAKLNVTAGDVLTVDIDSTRGNPEALDIDDAVEGAQGGSITMAGGAAPCYGDADGNGSINRSDLSAITTFLNANASAPFWTVPSSNPAYYAEADVDGNGSINRSDLSALTTYLNANAGAPFWTVACP